MAYFGDSKSPRPSTQQPVASTSIVPATPLMKVFGNPDIKGLIMAAAETPFCAEATKKGERCNRAWVYQNTLRATDQKASRYAPAPPRELDCSQYCSDQCFQWMPSALQSPPRLLYLWSNDELLGKFEIQRLRLILSYVMTRPDSFSRQQYGHTYECKFTGDSFQWYELIKGGQWDSDRERKLDPLDVAESICYAFRNKGSKLHLFTGPVKLTLPSPLPQALRTKFQNAEMSFGPRGQANATWIRPNKTWQQYYFDLYPEARIEYRTKLESWSPSEAISEPKQGGNSHPRTVRPGIINTLF
jgi:hypothetical protein